MARRSPAAQTKAAKSVPAAPSAPAVAEPMPDQLDEDSSDAGLADDLFDDSWGDVPATAVPGAEPERREQLVGTDGHRMRLDVFLVGFVPEFSRSHLKNLIDDACVEVDGQVAKSASSKVNVGQRVSVLLKPTAQSMAFVAEPMDLPIVFEDDHLMVVNKPAGLVVHPAAGNWTGTLMNGLLAHHADAATLPRAGIVHRLDKDTSGLMVVGKSLVAVTALSRAIAAREVSRQYLALVHGVVPEAFTVESSIGRDPSTRVRMAVIPSGKAARTDVLRLLNGEWAPPALGRDDPLPARSYSGVRCTLHTGRTHQIRVHLSSRKHPLVADALYGGVPALGMTRQALHAARLAFTHPVTGEALVFEADLPEDMAAAWQILSGDE
jgi:23S rRNA pseudouridine1911/1915/1917 synthase